MKKALFILAAAAMLLISGQRAKAQFYAGGSLGYSKTTLDPGDGTNNTRSGSSFKFLPEVGFQINERMSVGGTLGITQGYAAFGSFNPNDLKAFLSMGASASADIAANDTRVSGFRMAPYFRFVIFNTRRVDLFAEASLAYMSIKMRDKTTGVWQDAGSYTGFEMAARPGFAFHIDSHFSIVGHLGAMGYQTVKDDDTDMSINRVGMDVDSNNILLGFEYHF